MSKVWRFTGNPENWITAIQLSKWALNENNKSLWDKRIKPGDTVLFHSTQKSDFTNKAISSVIGFGYISDVKYEKNELWWIQETRDNKNYWPYVIGLKEIYLFSDTKGIDFSKPIGEKSEDKIKNEITKLVEGALPIKELNDLAKKQSPDVPAFPVNGSASGVNEIYENLILENRSEYFTPKESQDTEIIEKKLSEDIDEKLIGLSPEDLLSAARSYSGVGKENYVLIEGTKRVRKENQVQKRRVAAIEEYRCQVCGFKCEYTKSNGKKGWIIEVDHIIDKSDGGTEDLKNLWALCPNCHSKKTRGVITIDPKTYEVTENSKVVTIKDNHLLKK